MGGGSIPQETIERIRERTDIVEVVSGHLTLKRTGQNFTGLCPFHSEKTPSFVVSPTRQVFHCFGCHAGGDVFHFLMKMEAVSFPQAVRMLGERSGIRIAPPRSVTADERREEETEKLFQIHEAAAEFFRRVLRESKDAEKAREYFSRRGIGEKTREDFRLGYAPPSWDSLLREMTKKGWSVEIISRAGLIVPRERGDGYYDRFRDRVIFPIMDMKRRVIGFGGRCLDEALPKYLNSPDTPIYQKGKSLYAFEKAKDSLSREGALIIMEGYFDALAAHEAGVGNVAATLGTALTPSHLQLIRRWTKKVTLIFDPDPAGRAAVLRTLEMFLSSGLSVAVVVLPGGEDPDSFLQKRGREAFLDFLSKEIPLLEFAVREVVRESGATTREEIIGHVKEILLLFSHIRSPLERSLYLKRMSEELRIDEESVRAEYEALTKKRPFPVRGVPSVQEAVPSPEGTRFPRAERDLVQLLIQGMAPLPLPEGGIGPEDFTDERLRKIFVTLCELARERRVPTEGGRGQDAVDVGKLLDTVRGDDEMCRIIADLSLRDVQCDDVEKTVDGCLVRMREESLEREIRAVQGRLKEAEREKNDALQRELLLHTTGLLQKKKDIAKHALKK